jgi:hypothetical protein
MGKTQWEKYHISLVGLGVPKLGNLCKVKPQLIKETLVLL